MSFKKTFTYRNIYVVLATQEENDFWLVYFGFDRDKMNLLQNGRIFNNIIGFCASSQIPIAEVEINSNHIFSDIEWQKYYFFGYKTNIQTLNSEALIDLETEIKKIIDDMLNILLKNDSQFC